MIAGPPRTTRVVSIVEGPGESTAVPCLLAMVQRRYQLYNLQFDPQPVRANGLGNIYKEDGIERLVRIAVRTRHCDALLVLLDSEGECPKTKSEELAVRVAQDGGGTPFQIVYAHRQYETWLTNSAEDIRGRQAAGPTGEQCPILDPAMTPPEEAEPGGNAKTYLETCLVQNERYQETRDQFGWTTLMSCDLAYDRCRSFRRLVSALIALSRV